MTIIPTPIVKETLERSRQNLDKATSPLSLVTKIAALGVPELERVAPDRLWPLIEEFKDNCRKLGALDQVCAEYGITEAVMAEALAESPEPMPTDRYTEPTDARAKIIQAMRDSDSRRFGPSDICKATGLDFLIVAGAPTPRGKSLLDLMVDDGELVRDTSSGFHLYELPRA